MTFDRYTIRESCSFEGLTLHGGVPVRVRFLPGESGIAFRWNAERVLARPESVTGTLRSTRIGSISTIEHVMSAMAAHEITDVEVEVSEPELPTLDGASAVYWQAISLVGKVAIGTFECDPPYRRLFAKSGEAKVAIGAGEGRWSYTWKALDRWPPDHSFEASDVISQYGSEIAPARTVAFESEIEAARRSGLGKGCDESNVLILGETGSKNVARFADEPARHKLLDVIGDLYLSGVPIKALNVSAVASGHSLHVEAAKLLAQASPLQKVS